MRPARAYAGLRGAYAGLRGPTRGPRRQFSLCTHRRARVPCEARRLRVTAQGTPAAQGRRARRYTRGGAVFSRRTERRRVYRLERRSVTLACCEGSLPHNTRRWGAMECVIKCVVKLYCEGARPVFMLPWQVAEQDTWTGSGFVAQVGGKCYVVTNAHVVEHAFTVRVSRQQDSVKHIGNVVCVAHDLDLALVHVLELVGVTTIALDLASDLPRLFSVVHALGFPMGGTTACVTKGVVSRIDAQVYAHAHAKGFGPLCACTPGKLLILQIDAAINPGSSGGPALGEDGAVLGVASSGIDKAQNIGYVIPASLVRMFLDEFRRTGAWAGVCEAGFAWRTLENPTLRAKLGVEAQGGVMLTSVAPLGKLKDVAFPTDVLVAIDGRAISSEGTVSLVQTEPDMVVQLPLDYLITSKAKHEASTVTLVRDGRSLELSVVFAPIAPLLPRYEGVDAWPTYAIFGGLVFTRLSMPLYQEMLGADEGICLSKTSALVRYTQGWKQNEEEDIVVLLRVLRHAVNEGIDVSESDLRVVASVNGTKVTTLAGMVSTAMAELRGESPYLTFSFDVDTRLGVFGVSAEEVLPTQGLLAADDDIMAQNGISAPVSSDLRKVYRRDAQKKSAAARGGASVERSKAPKRRRDISDPK